MPSPDFEAFVSEKPPANGRPWADPKTGERWHIIESEIEALNECAAHWRNGDGVLPGDWNAIRCEDFQLFVIRAYFDLHGKIPSRGSWWTFLRRAIIEVQSESRTARRRAREMRQALSASKRIGIPL